MHPQIDLLIACKVVPDFARHELPSNRILRALRLDPMQRQSELADVSSRVPVSHSLHVDFDHHDVHLVPQHDALDARLAAEAAYQQLRTSQRTSDEPPPAKKARPSSNSSSLPARPDFSLFYLALESCPAVASFVPTTHFLPRVMTYIDIDRSDSPVGYGVVRTEQDIEAHNAAGRALLPPLVFPASTNLLIYSAKDRADQSPPAPPAVVADSEVRSPSLRPFRASTANAPHHAAGYRFKDQDTSPLLVPYGRDASRGHLEPARAHARADRPVVALRQVR